MDYAQPCHGDYGALDIGGEQFVSPCVARWLFLSHQFCRVVRRNAADQVVVSAMMVWILFQKKPPKEQSNETALSENFQTPPIKS